jgi:hypothetical protein
VIVAAGGIYFCLGHPHILSMANWQKSFTREPPRTKAELRQILTEAVGNTQPNGAHRPKQPPKVKTIAAEPVCID